MVSEKKQKCLIVYFSQGGATAQVADKISSGLNSVGCQVNLCNIKDCKPPFVKDYDLLGIGLPVYAHRPPFNVLDYIENLPKLTGLPVFVFLLYGGLKGDTGNYVRHILASKGAKDAGYFSCLGTDYYLGFLLEGYLLNPGYPSQEELNRAEDFGRQLAVKVNKKEFTKQPYDSSSPVMIFRLQRLLICRLLVRLFWSKMFSVVREKCNSCGLCMKICPKGNIKADKSGRPAWGSNCMLCFYCDLKCPREAITSPVKSRLLFRPNTVYNLRQAIKDPVIKYARVVLKEGRVKNKDDKLLFHS